MTHTVDRAINDAVWLADPRKTDADGVIEANELIDDELTLFEVEL
ncbi:hypothetical protein [Streptomyces ipomoeae]|nr:hypothetical protein [Streptomyces ipomoeae]